MFACSTDDDDDDDVILTVGPSVAVGLERMFYLGT